MPDGRPCLRPFHWAKKLLSEADGHGQLHPPAVDAACRQAFRARRGSQWSPYAQMTAACRRIVGIPTPSMAFWQAAWTAAVGGGRREMADWFVHCIMLPKRHRQTRRLLNSCMVALPICGRSCPLLCRSVGKEPVCHSGGGTGARRRQRRQSLEQQQTANQPS